MRPPSLILLASTFPFILRLSFCLCISVWKDFFILTLSHEVPLVSSMGLLRTFTTNVTQRQAMSSHGHELSPGSLTTVVLAMVFSSLATLFVASRFWVRRLKLSAPLLEDWTMLAALVCLTGYIKQYLNLIAC